MTDEWITVAHVNLQDSLQGDEFQQFDIKASVRCKYVSTNVFCRLIAS